MGTFSFTLSFIQPGHLLILPTRVITCILAFLSIVVAYMLRQALIYSLVHLVPKPIPTGSSEDVCPIDSNSTKAFGYSYSATARSTVYDWSGDEQSTIRSSFFWLYIFTHVPGALLAQRIGGRDASLFAMLICAIFTLVTPVALDWGGIAGLLVARVLVGAGEGILWPAVSTWVAAWVPPEERTQSVSLVFSGVEIGAFMGNICSGRLIDAYGWESTFYVFGGISVIWCLVTVSELACSISICYMNSTRFIDSSYSQQTIHSRIHTSATRRETIYKVVLVNWNDALTCQQHHGAELWEVRQCMRSS